MVPVLNVPQYSGLSPAYPLALSIVVNFNLGLSTPYQGPSSLYSKPHIQSWFCTPPDTLTAHGKNPFRLMLIFNNKHQCIFWLPWQEQQGFGPLHNLCIQYKKIGATNKIESNALGSEMHVNLDDVFGNQSFSPSMLPHVDLFLTNVRKVFLNNPL